MIEFPNMVNNLHCVSIFLTQLPEVVHRIKNNCDK